MATITEVAPDIYQISTFAAAEGLQFSQFLVKDEQPLLFHTGYKGMFPQVRDAVAQIIDPSTIRWIGFSHFEGDECGALNEFLAIAPDAQAICSLVGAVTSVNDFAIRPPRPLMDNEELTTGRRRFRFLQTPHVPHCWDAGLLFEETTRTLFSSDLLFQLGDVEHLTSSDIVQRSMDTLAQLQQTPLANSTPYTPDTCRIINSLADLKPTTLATHHGSVFSGNGEQALRDLAGAMKDQFARP